MAVENNRCKTQLSTLSSEFNEHLTCLQQALNKLWFLIKGLLEIKKKYSVGVLSLGFVVCWV